MQGLADTLTQVLAANPDLALGVFGWSPDLRRRAQRFLEQLCVGCGVTSCTNRNCITGNKRLRDDLYVLSAAYHATVLAKDAGIVSCMPETQQPAPTQQAQQSSQVAAAAANSGTNDATTLARDAAASPAAAAAASPASAASPAADAWSVHMHHARE